MKKWKLELIIVVVLLCMGGCIWWSVSTKDARKAKAQYEQLLNYANRQAVEIAVIEQAAKLELLKRTLAKGKKLQPVQPAPLVPDPKSLPE